jgi:hypothetical protein
MSKMTSNGEQMVFQLRNIDRDTSFRSIKKIAPVEPPPYVRISSHKTRSYYCKYQALPAPIERAFTHQRIYQLSNIRKVSWSSRGGIVRRKPADLADGLDKAEVMVKTKEQDVGPQEISSDDVSPADDARLPIRRGKLRIQCDELTHQRRAPKDALQLACLVIIQHRGSRVLRTFPRGGSLRLLLSVR